ncbi:MAG: sigma-54-dependent Fis family transcriptional regulator [Ignavibacteriales bacterium]|nr:sigma-54-dependent Fis family transcriptional regulator [Ignavibacteriales bacterium]
MASRHHILVVDDEEAITYLLKTELDDIPEFATSVANSVAEAMTLLQGQLYDLVLLDIKMPRVSGIEFLRHIKEQVPTTQVIMLTSMTDIRTAIETTKLGAYDFIGKPYDTQQLIAAIWRAIEHRQLLIAREAFQFYQPSAIIGSGKTIRELIEKAKKFAASESFVLIHGASGTGKELFAQLIHRHSPRKEQPFIAVNCAAMPDQLLESELFGHEKGSFTSAIKTKQGLVEVANGGTLFLDEVGDISTTTQPKLLRFLETGEFRRVGGTSTRKVDVRIVSATNKNLENEVKAGRFREDLLYRLNVVSLKLPPLKDRKEDIADLVNHFLARKSKLKRLSPQALQDLKSYDWPGNVRELEHVIEGAIALSHGDVIEPKDLWINASPETKSTGTRPADLSKDAVVPLKEMERIMIERGLKRFNYNRAKTASALGITTKALYLKIRRYKIKVPILKLEED